MWQRSYFYDKAYFATHGWHLRWFTLSTTSSMISIPDRADCERHRMKYPAFTKIEIDKERLVIRVINPIEGKRNFYLLAPSEEILHAVVEKMEEMIRYQESNERKTSDAAGSSSSSSQDGDENTDFEHCDDHVSLIEFPVGGSKIEILFFILLFPLRLVMHLSVPDVRVLDNDGNPVESLPQAFTAIGMCLVWLTFGSYAMVASLEKLAALMDIPDTVVGVTVSAAGTSLPNYVASRVAAEKGFGVS